MSTPVKIIKTTFKIRRGQSETWAKLNPKLEEGEPGYELDTGRLKIGRKDQNQNLIAWNDLFYIGEVPTGLPDEITTEQIKEVITSYSSDKENQIKVLSDGTMEINSLNISKLVQTEGDTLILDGSM